MKEKQNMVSEVGLNVEEIDVKIVKFVNGNTELSR